MNHAMDFVSFSTLYFVFWSFVRDANGAFESTYPHMSDFLADKIDPVANCPNFVCELSSLTGVQIDTLVSEENKRRNEYAVVKRISGLYRVYWSDALAKFARKKAQLCLPPTYDGSEEKYYIFDGGETLQKIFHPLSPILLNPATIQIVSGMRTENMDLSMFNPIMFKAKLLDYYVSLFNSREANFELRGGTTLMGCGYVIQRENSSIIDRLVCVYGMLYGGDDDFVLQEGQPCSKCDYYNYADKYADPRLLARDRLEVWNCDYTYTSLCTDLNKKPILEYKNSEFDCADEFFGLLDDHVPQKLVATTTKEPPREPVPIPCWYIFVPLMLIIIILIGLCCFHLVSSIWTYKKIVKKTVPK